MTIRRYTDRPVNELVALNHGIVIANLSSAIALCQVDAVIGFPLGFYSGIVAQAHVAIVANLLSCIALSYHGFYAF